LVGVVTLGVISASLIGRRQKNLVKVSQT
jgi:hypothetical protein